MQFTFIFNFRPFFPKPLSTIKRIPIVPSLLQHWGLKWDLMQRECRCGEKPPKLFHLILFSFAFDILLSSLILDVIFRPWSLSRVAPGSPLSGFVKWENKEKRTLASAVRCIHLTTRPCVWELHVKDDTILSSSCVNPWLSWVGGHVSNIRACAHSLSYTHTCTHTCRGFTVWPSPDFGYCLCGPRGGWGWTEPRQITKTCKNSGWERKNEKMCREKDGIKHEQTERKTDR